jgi:hypothetical protein
MSLGVRPLSSSRCNGATTLEANLTYPELPIKILDQKDRVTRCKTVKFFKVQWSNHSEEEAT